MRSQWIEPDDGALPSIAKAVFGSKIRTSDHFEAIYLILAGKQSDFAFCFSLGANELRQSHSINGLLLISRDTGQKRSIIKPPREKLLRLTETSVKIVL